MIGRLSGILISKTGDHVLLEAGGVGYEVYVSENTGSTLPAAGEKATLWIHTHVREDRIQLFGFGDILEKKTFEMLLGVSGVGVKLALAVLSSLTPEECLYAITAEDTASLSRVPGLGQKTAKRMILELKEKAKKELAGRSFEKSASSAVKADLASALANLGYGRSEIDSVLSKLPAEALKEFEPALRASLRMLAGSVGGR